MRDMPEKPDTREGIEWGDGGMRDGGGDSWYDGGSDSILAFFDKE